MQPRLRKADGTIVHKVNIRVASLRRTGDYVRGACRNASAINAPIL